jgi:hypothetical protein
MWLWLWKIYVGAMGVLCMAGVTSVPRFGGESAKCIPWDFEPFTTVRLIGDYLGTVYPKFGQLIMSTEESWRDRMEYWWENITVIIPDPQSQEWKDLGLVEEVQEKSCKFENSKTLCPRVRTFLKHHLVDGSMREGKKYKTKAGNKIWWNQVGDNRYLYPGAVKVLERHEQINGEMLMVERPLYSQARVD